jgi:CubicO group peptidase (beta-lactamase class C family)
MRLRHMLCLSATLAVIALSALAQGLPRAEAPEEVGFSSARLKRLSSAIAGDVEKGVLPGAVVLLARNGKVAYLEAFGFADREKQVPMRTLQLPLAQGGHYRSLIRNLVYQALID